jgi:hypothetical protein
VRTTERGRELERERGRKKERRRDEAREWVNELRESRGTVEKKGNHVGGC